MCECCDVPTALAHHDQCPNVLHPAAELNGVPRRSTLRCIADRLLPDGHEQTYLQREIINEKAVFQPPTMRFHIYCSDKNRGAMQLLEEFADNMGLTLQLAPSGLAQAGRCSSFHLERQKRANLQSTTLHVTNDIEQLRNCDFMLVYLTAQTWTRPDASSMFGSEVGRAMDAGVKLLLAHEMIGVGGQESRFGCEFANFFSCDDGATPRQLLERGIYGTIAVALKGGNWRKTSMVMLAKAFAGSDAVNQEDADELKKAQEISKSVQQELRLPASALAAVSKAARGHAVASTAATSVVLVMKDVLFHLSSRSSRLSLNRASRGAAAEVEVSGV